MVDQIRDANGAFRVSAFEKALNETVDLIATDQQPSLTPMQQNGPIAADNLVAPKTVKGFDLATLATNVSDMIRHFEFIMGFEAHLEIGEGRHMVLPTTAQEQNTQDTD